MKYFPEKSLELSLKCVSLMDNEEEGHSWKIERNERGRVVAKNTDSGTRLLGLKSLICHLLTA